MGGGGGDGNFSVGASGSLSKASTVNLGLGASIAGSGGQGGDGGKVTLKHQGSIETCGSSSPGLLAQSVGKGGGKGGFSVAGALSFVQQGAKASGSAALSLGGSGGQGGKGSDVALSALGLSDTIQTHGAHSEALLAQSLGGGGGIGGFSVAAGATVSGLASGSLSLGGGGGSGGRSGAVGLENENSIATSGEASTGILAQSVGGGGGNAGFSISSAANFKTPSKLSFAAAVSLGGKGGDGNTAGAVSVANAAAQIATQGKQAPGVLAQSIGGGGGRGGFSGSLALNVAPQDKTFKTEADSISLGGSGGTGNTAAAVNVSSISDISTEGDDSAAILAQSVGGGGGNGNLSAAVLWTGIEKIKFDEIKLSNVSLSIGGSGGKGGDGGAVAVDTTKTRVNGVDYASPGRAISTAGEASAGIYAQSVGGGGGQGSYRFTLTNVNTNAFSIVTEKAYKLINMGCQGGDGGKGNAVSITDNSSSIKTQGSQSEGILAQSVGGGGGKSGFGVKVGVSWDYKGQGSFLGNTGISLGGSGASGSNGGRADAVTVTEVLPTVGTKLIQTQGDQSDGICAQSVGGGGGKAGLSIKGSCNSGFTIPDNPMNFNHGGNGGDGGAVKVTALSDITTAGDHSRGIYAASIGHGGGDGGLFIGANWTSRAKADWWPFAGINTSMGGDGGEGGKGLQVSVDHMGSISTLNNSASGIHAQSLGGGGGSGGGSISAAGYNPQPGQKPKISASISRGGKGGKGGSADAVTVTNRGPISTGCADEEGFLAGNYAYGIFAQSLGGGGGDGGFSIAFAEQKGYGSFSGSFGGDGGSGDKAGQVSVANLGAITTRGDGAAGIYAHSLGDGGGSGGFSISGGITSGISLGLSLGGKGGDGGDADRVSISNAGSIQTGFQDPAQDGISLIHGHDAPGLDAASIGGGGGSGGFSIAGSVSLSWEESLRGSASVSVGGSGGKGGVGGQVDITSALAAGESILTLGDRSPGISALSQGGGGGNGGYSIAGSVQINNPKEMKGTSASVSVGGSGGSGGTAGAVTVVNSKAGSGLIATGGQSSPGIRAQSIAGGGGNGHFGIGGAIAVDPFFSTFASVLAGTGGQGGVGGDGHTVAITNTSSLATNGMDSPGILAQSIGAGGGSNGFSVRGEILSQITEKISVGSTKAASGQGREVTITSHSPTISTQGTNSSGIIGQSIGGGGGVSWVTIDDVKQVDVSASSAHLGGQGGSHGDGGAVSITTSPAPGAGKPNSLSVTGPGACGLLAQSIGGGGGILSTNAAPESLVIGGANATTGNGGFAAMVNKSTIQTTAQGSFGMMAQSIGGGGGLALYTGTGFIGPIKNAVPKGDATSSGNGAAVTMANYGKVATVGRGAIGMVAQSLGGGGNLNILTGEAGSAGGKGSGGTIKVDNYGDIATQGDYAHGIFAQSAGGAGQGGQIKINNYKNINVSGNGARPIYTVSTGRSGQGAIEIINRGTLSGAADGTAPLFLVGGRSNTLSNYGLITTAGEPVQGSYTSFTQAGRLQAGRLSFDTAFIQTGVTSATMVNELHVGQTAGSTALYTLISGSLTAGRAVVGPTGSGTIQQTGGTNTVTDKTILGDQKGGRGNYILSGGSFSTPALSILYGQFAQSGGSLHVADAFTVGPNQAAPATSWGSYQITGGTLEAPTINILRGGMVTWAGGTARYQDVNLEGGILDGHDVSGAVHSNLRADLPRTLTIHSGVLAASRAPWTIHEDTVILGGNFSLGTAAANEKITIVGPPVSLDGGVSGAIRTLTVHNTTEIKGPVVNGDLAAGASGITKEGAGTLILSGQNLYTGPTAINAGTLKLDGTGTLSSHVENNPGGRLALYSTAAAPLAGGVSWRGGSFALGPDVTYDLGAGPYEVAANASLELAAGSVLNAPGGVISLGSVILNGTLNADLSNDAGSLLMGNGLIHGQALNTGTVNPGNSIGTLHVVGSYTQSASSLEIVEIASPNQYDRIVVTGTPGTVSLAGALAPTPFGGFKPRGNQVFADVVTASGGLSGSFSSIVNQQFTPTLAWQTSYDATSVDLSVQRHYTNANLGLNTNQQAVGNRLNSMAGVTSGDLDTVLDTIDYLPDSASVRQAYQQISPEKSAALAQLALTGAAFQMRQQAQRVSDQRFGSPGAGSAAGSLGALNLNYSSRQGLLLAYNANSLAGLLSREKAAPSASPWGLYLYPAVIVGSQQSTANQTGYHYTMAGFTLGADCRINDHWIVGLASGYSHTGAGFKGSGGTVQTNTWPLTAYGAYLGRSWYAYGSLGYALNFFRLDRDISFGGLQRTASGSPTGHQLNAYGEAGYDVHAGKYILTTMLSLAYSALWLNGYTESGAGALNLTMGAQQADSLQTGVGLKMAALWQWGAATVIPQIFATYQHEFANHSRGLNASLSGSGFVWSTDAPQRDFALLGAKVDLCSRQNLRLGLSYTAEVGRSRTSAHALYAGLRWQF